MNLPSSVKVGAHTYKVLFPYKFREVTDHMGQADHNLLEIRMMDCDLCGNKMAESQTLGTFVHEVIHCVSEVWCVGLEEKQVEQLEEGFMAVLVDNGWLKK